MNGSATYNLLEKLGLTEYEAKTLNTLFTLRESQAPTISRTAQVPKTRVYDVLEKLIAKDLIIEIKGRPKLYRAIDAEKEIEVEFALRITNEIEEEEEKCRAAAREKEGIEPD